MAKAAQGQQGGFRVTPTGVMRTTAAWKIVPSTETLVKGSTQELFIDAAALDRCIAEFQSRQRRFGGR